MALYTKRIVPHPVAALLNRPPLGLGTPTTVTITSIIHPSLCPRHDPNQPSTINNNQRAWTALLWTSANTKQKPATPPPARDALPTLSPSTPTPHLPLPYEKQLQDAAAFAGSTAGAGCGVGIATAVGPALALALPVRA